MTSKNVAEAAEYQPKHAEKVSQKKPLKFLRDALIVVVIAVVVSFLLKTCVVRSFYIPSSSMEETLQVNDRVLVNQMAMNFGGPGRGDVVVFKDPGGWLHATPEQKYTPFEKALQFVGILPDGSASYVIKRVIGVGGDRVQYARADGKIRVNGQLIDEPYAVVPPGQQGVSGLEFDVTVPEGSLWVMGDNRYASKDSRYNQDQPGRGFVSKAEVVGVAFMRNWPLGRIEFLGNYPDSFKHVPDKPPASLVR
ncbi:MAG: signal peptidase I [Microbacteriaceae bacterium]|nr:signal peptidase I [Microbacteriaceae bacterium]